LAGRRPLFKFVKRLVKFVLVPIRGGFPFQSSKHGNKERPNFWQELLDALLINVNVVIRVAKKPRRFSLSLTKKSFSLSLFRAVWPQK
jgi:hypothetical protein